MAQVVDQPDIPEPDMQIIDEYRRKVLNLAESIYENPVSPAMANAIRPLIEKIVLYPDNGKLKARVEGNIQQVLTLGDAGEIELCHDV